MNKVIKMIGLINLLFYVLPLPGAVQPMPANNADCSAVARLATFASASTGFTIERPIACRLATREEALLWVRHRLEENPKLEQLIQHQAALKKLGLLPRDTNLRTVIERMTSQLLLGFYDNNTKTLNILEGIQREAVEPILVHEIVHALQDQHRVFDDWTKAGPRRNKCNKDSIFQADQNAARIAVIEGQATAAQLSYLLQRIGKSLKDCTWCEDSFRTEVLHDHAQRAQEFPLYVRNWDVFTYADGFRFIREILLKGGIDLAFKGVFEHPPCSTYEIRNPQSYLGNEQLSLPTMPRFHWPRHFKLFSQRLLGPVDVLTLVEQSVGDSKAKEIAEQWRGGVFLSAINPATMEHNDHVLADSSNVSPSLLALVYISKWSSAEAARKFAETYPLILSRKYTNVRPSANAFRWPVEGQTTGWQTEDGAVFVVMYDDSVIVVEGFDEKTAHQFFDQIARQWH